MRRAIVWKHFAQLGPFRWKQINPGRAARGALGVILPLALGAVSGHVDLGAYAALGAFSAGVASFQGEARSRVAAVLVASIGMALSTFIGATSAAISGWLLVPIIGVWGYGTGLAVALGQHWSIAVLQWAIALLIAVSMPSGPHEAGLRALLVLAGGFGQAILVALSWAVRPGAREREALAQSYRALATYASLLADGKFAAPAPAVFPARITLTDPNPLVPSAVRLVFIDLLEEAERIRASLAGLAAATADHELRAFLYDAATALPLIADALCAPRKRRLRVIRELRRVLIHRSVAADAPWRWAGEALLGQLRAVGRILVQLETVQPSRLAEPSSGSEPQIPNTTGAAWLLITLRANATLASEAGRHALRLGLTAALAEVLVQVTGLYQGRWVTLTILLILKPDYASTIYRSMQRALGTGIGVAAGLGAVLAIPHPEQGGLMIAAVVCVAAAYALFDVGYLLFNIFLTAFIVVLLDLLGSPALLTAEARFLDTFIGAVLGLTAYIAWPTWEGATAQEKFARVIEAHRDYALALLRACVQPAAEREPQLRSLQARARRARNDAEAATARLADEPAHAPLTPAVAQAVIAAVTRLAVAELALHALVLERPAPTEQTSPRERVNERIGALAAALETAMSRLAMSFRALAQPSAIPPLRSVHVELRDQSGPSEAALVGLTDRVIDAVDTLDEILRKQFPPQRPEGANARS